MENKPNFAAYLDDVKESVTWARDKYTEKARENEKTASTFMGVKSGLTGLKMRLDQHVYGVPTASDVEQYDKLAMTIEGYKPGIVEKDEGGQPAIERLEQITLNLSAEVRQGNSLVKEGSLDEDKLKLVYLLDQP